MRTSTARIIVASLFALIFLGCSVWAAHRAGDDDSPGFGIFAGCLFCMSALFGMAAVNLATP